MAEKAIASGHADSAQSDIFPIETRGFYLSPEGPEGSNHGKWCQIIAYCGEGRLHVQFDDLALGVMCIDPEQFYPRLLSC